MSIADGNTASSGKSVRISIVGKYIDLKDSYVSVKEAVHHASHALHVNPEINWVEATDLTSEKDVADKVIGSDGVIIPGGFGSRGIEGKIMAIKYAIVKLNKENNAMDLATQLGLI